ncbi:MAG: motility protein A [Candidatus Neomarinimicrobiota bacterium]|nr:MAG: motility protein A [Candidatus Neomarinimicrobiota bacterium]
MDIATIIGIIVGLGSIGGGIYLAASAAGASMAGFLSTSSFAIVFGGMLASVSVAFPLSEVLKLGSAIAAVFKGGQQKLGDLVDQAVSVAEVARKGTVELEKEVNNIQNPFFKDGVQMVVDGYSIEELTDILNNRIEYREIREKTQADLFKTMGTMAPAWGMIGTLIGLVIMLAGFGGEEGGGTDALGSGMSAALITTFYGAIFANLFFLPMAAKLTTRISYSSTMQALLVEATRLIHQKKHPLIVREKLNSFIPPREWKQEEV